jgi:hypothetical protein
VVLAFTTMLCCGLVWSLEHFDPTIRAVHDVEDYLRIPVLAAVPRDYKEYRNGKNGHSKNGHNGNGNQNGNGVKSANGTNGKAADAEGRKKFASLFSFF